MESGLLKEKGLIASLSIFSMFLAAKLLYSKLQPSSKKPADAQSSQMQQKQISKQLDNLTTLQELLQRKSQQLQITYLSNAPHILTAECIQDIFEFTPAIIDKDQLEKIYMNNRKARRSCLPFLKEKLGQGTSSELEIFYRFVCTFEEEIQYLIEKTQKDFVIFLNIDYGVITESIDFHMWSPETGLAQWIKNWSMQIKQQLKEKLKLYESPITPQKIIEVIDFQVKVLVEEGENFKKAVNDLNLETEEEHQAIPSFLELFLEDLIFEKYRIQIEQINLSADEITPQLSDKMHVLAGLKQNIIKQICHDDQQEYSQGFSQNCDDLIGQ